MYHTGPRPSHVHARHVSGPHLQNVARWNGSRILGKGRTGDRTVRLDPRSGVPLRERTLYRRITDMARAEGHDPRLKAPSSPYTLPTPSWRTQS